jgi:hypothetical protein
MPYQRSAARLFLKEGCGHRCASVSSRSREAQSKTVLDAAELTTTAHTSPERAQRSFNKITVPRLTTVETTDYTDAKAQKDRTAHCWPPAVQFTSWLQNNPRLLLGVPLHEHGDWLRTQETACTWSESHVQSKTRYSIHGYAPFIYLHNT